MDKTIEKVSVFVHDYLLNSGKTRSGDWGPEYRWEHTLRVACWAKRLATEEKADIEKCVVAALMHDVSHFVSEDYRQHGVKSAEVGSEFLLNEGYAKEFVEAVAYAIKSHVGEFHPKTLEAKILQDADTLDRFGYIRLLLLGRAFDVSSLGALSQRVKSSLEYTEKVEKGEYGPMWTRTGDAKLKRLLDLYKTVLKGVLKEIEDTKL